jgi:hypothetical protein
LLTIRGKVLHRKVFGSIARLILEYFFPPAPDRGYSGDNFGDTHRANGVEPSSDDFGLEDTPVRPSQASKPSQRGSTRSSNRSTRSGRQQLFVQDDASDNDLGFDD